ncbi:MAG: carboxypeptidase-like regulatory domain-containing protein [Chthoniobacterales bacterium]
MAVVIGGIVVLRLSQIDVTDSKRVLVEEGPTTPSASGTVTQDPSPFSAANQTAPAPDQRERFVSAFNTPVSFFGRVLDQNDLPVPQANVKIAANDKAFGGRPSEYFVKSDDKGFFSVEGIRGVTLSVEVTKPEYRVIPPTDGAVTSSGVFDYGLPASRTLHQPRRETPVTFRLYRPGVFEALEKTPRKNIRLAKDGTPRNIALDSVARHQVIVSCSTSDSAPARRDNQYDWRLKIVVPDGGLVAATDSYIAEAPPIGYRNEDVINEPASLPRDKWSDQVQRSYFIRFNDDVYARVAFVMHAHGDHFITWESILNPKAGSRNLEQPAP